MELYEAINRRRTVRDFTDEPVPAEAVERIIDAALKAPTNDHMRDWYYIVIDDSATAHKLLNVIPRGISEEDMRQLIIDWNLSDKLQQACYREAVPKQYRMLIDASVIVVPLLKEKTDILHPENISHLNGFASIWCSIENMLLAATAEGYGCSLRIPLGEESEHAREVLGFPEDYFMPCFIGIGRLKPDARPVQQQNIDASERIRRNGWNSAGTRE